MRNSGLGPDISVLSNAVGPTARVAGKREVVWVVGHLQWMLLAWELISFCLFTSPSVEVNPDQFSLFVAVLSGGWVDFGKGQGEAWRGDWSLGLADAPHAWPKSRPGDLSEGNSLLWAHSLPAHVCSCLLNRVGAMVILGPCR